MTKNSSLLIRSLTSPKLYSLAPPSEMSPNRPAENHVPSIDTALIFRSMLTRFERLGLFMWPFPKSAMMAHI